MAGVCNSGYCYSMKDPSDEAKWETFTLPPTQGPGSGKAAWQRAVRDCVEANQSLMRTIGRQSETILQLQAENEMLREQLEARKPAGSRERVPSDKVERIEGALRRGEKQRHIARQMGVSAMTVSRINKQMRERDRRAQG